jgi:hypothetical protein
MRKLTDGQKAKRELNSRMAFHPLMNAAMIMSHNQSSQIRLSNAIAEMQSDPVSTHTDMVEVLADFILNELRNTYDMS